MADKYGAMVGMMENLKLIIWKVNIESVYSSLPMSKFAKYALANLLFAMICYSTSKIYDSSICMQR